LSFHSFSSTWEVTSCFAVCLYTLRTLLAIIITHLFLTSYISVTLLSTAYRIVAALALFPNTKIETKSRNNSHHNCAGFECAVITFRLDKSDYAVFLGNIYSFSMIFKCLLCLYQILAIDVKGFSGEF
jgi:hypothetical protein